MTDLDSPTGAPALPWHLAGNFEPVTDELDVDGLEVDGQLPEGLEGTYVRNGFNPRTGWSPHWFFGHGMVHAVDLAHGRARYRNRYVRTPFWDDAGADLSVLLEPDRSPANTNIVRHNGQWLALEEQHQPYALDDDLRTLALQDFGGAVTGTLTAHPRQCPVTGELLAFGYQLVHEPYLTYHRISASDGSAEVHTTSERTRVGEPVFAPAGPDAAEDEGWVLVFAHDEAEDRTELRIIDAQDFAGPPVARVRLPRRVPYGAHGAWLPA